LIVDIGGGTTNIAIIASGGIISSASLLAAGNAMDEAVRDYVRVRHGIQIGERTSERLKIELGAASDGGDRQSAQMEIVGKQLANGAALPVEIGSDEVRIALEPVLAQISAAVRRMIEDAKPEVTADIYYSGVVLTGGGALLKGMSERLQRDLSLHVATPDDPLTAVALGAGRLLGEPEKLQRAAIRQDAPVWEEAEKLVVNW
jgi:rod shape-determining protein MreB